MSRQPESNRTTTTIVEEQSNDTSVPLRLRGTGTRRPRVRWQEGTVDNEHMGKKKSKSMYNLQISSRCLGPIY